MKKSGRSMLSAPCIYMRVVDTKGQQIVQCMDTQKPITSKWTRKKGIVADRCFYALCEGVVVDHVHNWKSHVDVCVCVCHLFIVPVGVDWGGETMAWSWMLVLVLDANTNWCPFFGPYLDRRWPLRLDPRSHQGRYQRQRKEMGITGEGNLYGLKSVDLNYVWI